MLAPPVLDSGMHHRCAREGSGPGLSPLPGSAAGARAAGGQDAAGGGRGAGGGGGGSCSGCQEGNTGRTRRWTGCIPLPLALLPTHPLLLLLLLPTHPLLLPSTATCCLQEEMVEEEEEEEEEEEDAGFQSESKLQARALAVASHEAASVPQKAAGLRPPVCPLGRWYPPWAKFLHMALA